jgi:transposase
MRESNDQNDAMFIYTSPAGFVPKGHPLRPIRTMVDKALVSLSKDFSQMYSHTGRPSIPPERLFKAFLLQALYSIRSNRLLVEQIGYSILFRRFIGMALDEPVWDHSTFSQNQNRLIGSDVAAKFFKAIKQQAKKAGLLSDEHFSVDGRLAGSLGLGQELSAQRRSPQRWRRWSKRRGQLSWRDTHQ